MPSGGAVSLPDDEMQYVFKTYEDAVRNGLQYEWLSWFAGGIWKCGMTPSEAALAAAIEWDF